jgi:hypothetical protein
MTAQDYKFQIHQENFLYQIQTARFPYHYVGVVNQKLPCEKRVEFPRMNNK